MNILIEKDVMVTMSDGTKLASDIYRPQNATPLPAILVRVPYNKESPKMLMEINPTRLVESNYAVVIQDDRGTSKSQGEFIPFINEGKDGYDTVKWIASQSWCDGNIGTLGGSYVGIAQWLTAAESPKELKAIAPDVTWSSAYEGLLYRGGTFEIGLCMNWAVYMLPKGIKRPNLNSIIKHIPLNDIFELKAASSFYFDWLNHKEYDSYWKAVSPNEYYDKITTPVLNISGWYDTMLSGTLENYSGMKEKGASKKARENQKLIIGPWSHLSKSGVFRHKNFGHGSSAGSIDLTGIYVCFFDSFLKGIENGTSNEKPVKIFVMGINKWRDEDDWPLPDTKYVPYYLKSGGNANITFEDGTLSFEKPGHEKEDTYIYDPLNPVLTYGGSTLMKNIDSAGPKDQSSIEKRPDVLCYTTLPLKSPLEVTGPIKLILNVSSSAVDTDFTGKLVDVYPDGQSVILTDGILRMRYRGSFSNAELINPGHIYEISINMSATSNVFLPGHRIRLEVSSSNFPRFSRNSNSGGDIISEPKENYVSCVNKVYHDINHLSYILLPIIDR